MWPLLLLPLALPIFSLAEGRGGDPRNFYRESYKIEGVSREAIIFIPPSASTSPAPVVFAFHGHGGSMRRTVGQFSLPRIWPKAISVYMQGLNTVSDGDPEGRKPGWQSYPGDYGDRDLKFFDAVLDGLIQSGKADADRIYATGFSNGGSFAYVLCAARGDRFAAVAPCAAPNAHKIIPLLNPKPVLNITGRKDLLVKFANQEKAIADLRQLNGCEGSGRPWGKFGKLYPSASGTPLIAVIHPGGHVVPANIPIAIVKFFQGDFHSQ